MPIGFFPILPLFSLHYAGVRDRSRPSRAPDFLKESSLSLPSPPFSLSSTADGLARNNPHMYRVFFFFPSLLSPSPLKIHGGKLAIPISRQDDPFLLSLSLLLEFSVAHFVKETLHRSFFFFPPFFTFSKTQRRRVLRILGQADERSASSLFFPPRSKMRSAGQLYSPVPGICFFFFFFSFFSPPLKNLSALSGARSEKD